MGKVGANNPQLLNLYKQAGQGSVNPADVFKQVTQGYSPAQLEKLFEQAKQYGISDTVINQVKNIK